MTTSFPVADNALLLLSDLDDDVIKSHEQRLFKSFGSSRDILRILIENSKNVQQLNEIYAILNLAKSRNQCKSKTQNIGIPSKSIPKYIHPLNPTIKDPNLFLKSMNHNFDPLGNAYKGLNEYIILMEININKDLINFILSYISYNESTFNSITDKDVKSFGCSSNPKTNRHNQHPYGSEMILIITPPKTTFLPSKEYILDYLRIYIKYPNAYNNTILKCKIFVGIQEFNISCCKSPGSGRMLYGEFKNITDNDKYLIIEPNLSLECGKSYSFWITCIEGVLNSPLLYISIPWNKFNKKNDRHIQVRKDIHLTMGDVMYYCCNPKMNEYTIRREYYKLYEIRFVSHIN